VRYLVAPALLAMLVMLPVLTVLADLVAISARPVFGADARHERADLPDRRRCRT
jgi:phospholipid/cholesterol/gamma-HCH transport system permease protein